MKIVDLKTFLAMPDGTVFAKYEPLTVEGWAIKSGNVGDRDFCYQDLELPVAANDSGEMSEKLHRSELFGDSVQLDFYECTMRDGCFEDKQLFAVMERSDVESLISRLTQALSDSAA